MEELKQDDDEYNTYKVGIKASLALAANNFFEIGYFLNQIKDKELYRQDGYKDIWEFAKTEYGLSMSSASRFMAIHKKFSLCGTDKMAVEYANYGPSKLQEMLTMSEDELEQVTPDMTVKEIRQVKKKNCDVAKEKTKPEEKKPELEEPEVVEQDEDVCDITEHEDELIAWFYNQLSISGKMTIERGDRTEITEMLKNECGKSYLYIGHHDRSCNCYPDKICFQIGVGGRQLEMTWTMLTAKLLKLLDKMPELMDYEPEDDEEDTARYDPYYVLQLLKSYEARLEDIKRLHDPDEYRVRSTNIIVDALKMLYEDCMRKS